MKEILTRYSTLRYVAQNLAAEHYERYFDKIFHFNVAQNLAAEHYERYFDKIFHFNVAQN